MCRPLCHLARYYISLARAQAHLARSLFLCEYHKMEGDWGAGGELARTKKHFGVGRVARGTLALWRDGNFPSFPVIFESRPEQNDFVQ